MENPFYSLNRESTCSSYFTSTPYALHFCSSMTVGKFLGSSYIYMYTGSVAG